MSFEYDLGDTEMEENRVMILIRTSRKLRSIIRRRVFDKSTVMRVTMNEWIIDAIIQKLKNEESLGWKE